MIKGLRNIIFTIIAALNIMAVLAMIAVGYSPYIDPIDYPFLSSLGLTFPITLATCLAFMAFWVFFWFRMIIISILGFIAVCLPIRTYLPLNLPESPPEGAIKVMSFNIKHYYGMDGSESSYDKMLEYLKHESPDIFCTQEDVPEYRNKLKDVKSLFPHCSISVTETKEHTMGNCIYSKYPIIRSERIEFASDGNTSVAFYLKIGSDTVLVVNNHLESTHLSPDQRQAYKDILRGEIEGDTAKSETKKLFRQLADATRMRAPQADAVAEYVRNHSHYPTIVCGDFNDSPISYTHRIIAEQLTDCFVATGNGLGISYNQGGFFVRIDNIMCSDHFTPYGCVVDNDAKLSDHYPIYCWLKMSGNH